MSEDDGQVTYLLAKLRDGDVGAQAALIRLLEHELHEMAARLLSQERPGHTLRPSDLVQETFVKILGRENKNWENRKHLVRSVSRMMRNILVDHARKYQTAKHQKPQQLEPVLDQMFAASVPPLAANMGLTPQDLEKVIPIHEAIESLEREHPRQAEVVQLRVFSDLTDDEIAQVLDVGKKTISRDLNFARAWINRALNKA